MRRQNFFRLSLGLALILLGGFWSTGSLAQDAQTPQVSPDKNTTAAPTPAPLKVSPPSLPPDKGGANPQSATTPAGSPVNASKTSGARVGQAPSGPIPLPAPSGADMKKNSPSSASGSINANASGAVNAQPGPAPSLSPSSAPTNGKSSQANPDKAAEKKSKPEPLPVEAKPQPEPTKLDPILQKKEADLKDILLSIKNLNNDLKQKQQDLKNPANSNRKEEIGKQIQNIIDKIRTMEENFQEIAGGIDMKIFSQPTVEVEIQWDKELKDILSPIINEGKRLTDRPREMDRLQRELAYYERQFEVVSGAVRNIALISQRTDERFKHMPDEIKKKDDETKALLPQLQKLDEQLKDFNTQLQQLNEQELQLNDQLQKSEARLQKNPPAAQRDTLQKQIDGLKEQLASLALQKAPIEAQRSPIQSQRDDMQKRRDALQGEKNSLIDEQKNTLPLLEKNLESLKKDFTDKWKSADTEVRIIKQKIEQRLNERQKFGAAIQSLFQIFFRSRGKNFVVAGLAGIMFWLFFSRLYTLIKKIRPIQRREKDFTGRILKVIYTFFSMIGAVIIFMVVLYLMSDWVLLTFSVLFILGVLWTSKQAIHLFWSQMAMLLNMGEVREGERLIYNGLPWLVKSINFYCQFSNPLLMSGTIRLPLRDLQNLRSRPICEDEPWFPTQTNDWVMLSDGTYGQVLLQTPEIVKLSAGNGSSKIYVAQDFIARHPHVISKGYVLKIVFGIDYCHQAEATQKIPALLKEFIRAELIAVGFDESKVTNVNVRFEEAAASSLNLAILFECSGSIASDYYPLRAMMQRLCLEACEKYGWNVPFNQMMVHLASTTAQPA
jgi:predicted  nucleic acid-binding Zn-ribbon protein